MYVSVDKDGNNFIMKFEEEKGFINLTPIFTDTESTPISIIAERDSVVYKINKSTLDYFLETSNEFMNFVLKHLSNNSIRNFDHSKLLALKTIKEKVYNFLKINIDFENLVDSDWYSLRYKYKQQEIAEYVGATRNTVWKVMNELTKEGLVRIVNNEIQVRVNK